MITRRLLTAEKANDRARLTTFRCTLPGDCPLLAKGQCIHLGFMSVCVYGKAHTQRSQTKRARSYRDFVARAREAMEAQPEIKAAEDRIAYIGEYVYLPYAHMNHDDGKHDHPFLSHSHIFSSGSAFMPREQFTPEMVVKLFKFKPRTFMDNAVIKNYTEVSLPKFLVDLSEHDPDLYAAAVALESEIAEVVAKASPTTFTAAELGAYSGNIEIDGQPYFRYSDGDVRGKVKLSGFPTEREVDIRFQPRPDTVCTVLDRKDAIKLLRKRNS